MLKKWISENRKAKLIIIKKYLYYYFFKTQGWYKCNFMNKNDQKNTDAY